MANAPGTHQEGYQQTLNSSSYDGNTLPNVDTYAPKFNYHQGISMDWTPEEQAMLEDGLAKYASESNIIRYAKIAVQLKNKTVRDVALRCKWITKKENNRRRKEELGLSRKSKDKKEKLIDSLANSSSPVAQPEFTPYAPGVANTSYNGGISYNAFGGEIGELLQQNAWAFDQISSNLAAHQMLDNITLLCQARDNLLKIMNTLGDISNTMKQMPSLPVKINEELANSVLPPSNLPLQ